MQRTPRIRRPPKKDYTTPDIIRLVRDRPILWDKQWPGYHNSTLREAAWHEVSSNFFDCSAKKALKVWSNARKALRNQANRIAEKERSGMSLEEIKKIRPYRHTALMSFLKGNNTTEKQHSNLNEEDESDCESDSEADSPDPVTSDSESEDMEESDEEGDENHVPQTGETGVEFSVRQQLKKSPLKRTALKALNLNFDTEGKKLAKDAKLENEVKDINQGEKSDDALCDKEKKAEEAKRKADEKKVRAKLERQRKKDALREERLDRIRAKVKARAREEEIPPLNQKKAVSSKQDGTNTMEVVIKEEPSQKQTPMTLFCLSIAARLDALPLAAANALTLPILALVVETENKTAQSSSSSLEDFDGMFMTKQDEVVQQALKVPANRVAVAGLGYEMKGRDMATLKPRVWLNDQVVNMYFKLIEKRNESDPLQPSVKAFSTFFFPTLRKKLDRDVLTTDGIDKEILLVPVHHDHGHWSLMIIENSLKTITLYDSLEIKTEEALDHIEVIVNFLQSVVPDFDRNDWFKIHETEGPKQSNGSDCGVFVCTYAEFLTRGAATDFTQDQMPSFRKKMIYEIMTQAIDSKLKW